MSKLVGTATEALRRAVCAAMEAAMEAGDLPRAELPEFTLEVPADRAHGDWACNAAMVGARAFRTAPRKIAEAVAAHLSLDGTYFERAEIAGPGFLNFFLRRSFYSDVLRDVIALGDGYGRSDYGAGRRVMVEFVSANPTGPMHMGNARGGALGDCLAAVLDAAGYDVWREFYVNDAGNQIEKFGLSLDIRYQQIYRGDAVALPEDSYHGEDIVERTSEFAALYGDRYLDADEKERRAALVAYALPKNIEKMKADMKKYRITFDEWFLESTLHRSGEVADTIGLLREKGLTYEKDGALWYRATQTGAEKDEVLIRQNGMPTYFAADIAYHRNKLETRGFDRCIDIWGADHHGHVARLKGALQAIGIDSSRLDIVLMQLVRLMRDGEVVRMSKRTGKAIQLADLLDEVPVDAARFLFNLREANAQMDFDLDLAVQQDAQNPVYYVQYANARICSILRALEKEGIAPRDCTDEELARLDSPEEMELIRHIAAYTDEITGAARDYDPARITRYVITLATLFHKFYNAKRVKGEEDGLLHARLLLCVASRTVIRNVLRMFNISAPETM